MDSYTQDELEAFLVEAEMINKQVQDLAAGRITVEELDKIEERKKARKQRELDAEEKKKQEYYEMKKKGRYGKGVNKGYMNFCKFCFREYDLPTPECYQCGKTTQTYDERMEYLREKAKVYQKEKMSKQERKKKWELWKKTQAMLWKKTSTNYSKWDNFTSSSEEEVPDNSDPIVPKDDPQFMALEADINKRNQRRKEDRLKAEELKQKGNQRLKEGDYEKAVLWYSEALELCKDNMALWNNRALAWIKLKYYKKAIKDCTKVLDYCECFEDGYEKSKETCFKAFLRRALANKERKNVREAKDDIEQALKLFKDDKDALNLKKEILQLEQHVKEAQILREKQIELEKQKQEEEEKLKESQAAQAPQMSEKTQFEIAKEMVQKLLKEEEEKKAGTSEKKELSQEEIKKMVEDKLRELEKLQKKKELSFAQVIDKFFAKDVSKITEKKVEKIRTLILQNKNAKVYFFEKKGIEKIIELVKQGIRCYLFINFFLKDNVFYQNEFLKHGGISLLHKKIDELVTSAIPAALEETEDILEVLITLSTEEKVRDFLKDDKETIEIIEQQWNRLLPQFREEPNVVSNYLIYVSNLCYQQSKYKAQAIKNSESYLRDIYKILQFSDTKKGPKFEYLCENCFNLLSNFLVELPVREQFQKGRYRQILEATIDKIQQYDIVKNPKLLDPAKAALSVFVNTTFQSAKECQDQMNEIQAGEVIFNRYIGNKKLTYQEDEKMVDLINRGLQFLSKLNYSNLSLLKRDILKEINKYLDDFGVKSGFANHVLRIWVQILQEKECETYIKEKEITHMQLVCKKISQFIQQDDLQRFCNSCTLGGILCQLEPSLIPLFHNDIQRLIYICKETTDTKRQNGAIFLAKLAKNQEALQKIRDLHGIEVLYNISQFVVKKN